MSLAPAVTLVLALQLPAWGACQAQDVSTPVLAQHSSPFRIQWVLPPNASPLLLPSLPKSCDYRQSQRESSHSLQSLEFWSRPPSWDSQALGQPHPTPSSARNLRKEEPSGRLGGHSLQSSPIGISFPSDNAVKSGNAVPLWKICLPHLSLPWFLCHMQKTL